MSKQEELRKCESCSLWIAAKVYDQHILRCEPAQKVISQLYRPFGSQK